MNIYKKFDFIKIIIVFTKMPLELMNHIPELFSILLAKSAIST